MKRSSRRRSRSRSRSSSYASSGSEQKGGMSTAHNRLGRRVLGMRNRKSNFSSGFANEGPPPQASE